MKAKELNEKLNKLIIEKGYNTREDSFWETRELIKNLVEKVLQEIPNTEFTVRSGYRFEDENRNNIYVYTDTHSYIDTANNHLLCEIKLHRVKMRTRYVTRSYHYSLWAVDKVIVKAFKDVDFEEEYKIAKAEAEQVERERKEKEAREKAEMEERNRQYEIEATAKAQKILDYIKEHNLDIGEFEDMAYTYHNYMKYFHKLTNKESD